MEENRNRVWGLIPTILWSLLVVCLFVSTQIIALLIYVNNATGSISAESVSAMSNNGDALSYATISTLFVCGLAVLGIVKLKKNSIGNYIGLNTPGIKQLLAWVTIVILLVMLSDFITYVLGRKVVPEFMIKTYSSATNPFLLFISFLIAAPIFEELFFRGFILSSLKESFIGVTGSIIISAAAWASIHLQYDLYGIFTIFFIGVVLGFAKIKTNSIFTTIVMHSVMNFIALTEVAIHMLG